MHAGTDSVEGGSGVGGARCVCQATSSLWHKFTIEDRAWHALVVTT